MCVCVCVGGGGGVRNSRTGTNNVGMIGHARVRRNKEDFENRGPQTARNALTRAILTSAR